MTVRCACGWQTIGSEDVVVRDTQEHGRRLHNMLPTRDEVLAMVLPASGAGHEADSSTVKPPGPDTNQGR
jgi:hypothetical protein